VLLHSKRFYSPLLFSIQYGQQDQRDEPFVAEEPLKKTETVAMEDNRDKARMSRLSL
jgi:hypothetical protein